MNGAPSLRGLLRLALLVVCAFPAGTFAFKLRAAAGPSSGPAPIRRSVRAFAQPKTVERIANILAAKYEKEAGDIDVDCDFLEEFGADSLDEVEILLAVEEEFDLTIPDYDFNELRTVKALADYVDRKQGREKEG